MIDYSCRLQGNSGNAGCGRFKLALHWHISGCHAVGPAGELAVADFACGAEGRAVQRLVRRLAWEKRRC